MYALANLQTSLAWPTPDLLAPIPDNAGNLLRLIVKGTRGAGTSGFSASLSIDLSTK